MGIFFAMKRLLRKKEGKDQCQCVQTQKIMNQASIINTAAVLWNLLK